MRKRVAIGKAMWPRRSESGRHRIDTGRDKVFGFCSGAPPFVTKRKNRSLWLPARVDVVPAVNQVLGANAGETHTVGCQVSDVTPTGYVGATSPAYQVVHARTKSWRFAGGGSGAEGKAGAAKAKSLDGLPSRKPAFSKFSSDVTPTSDVGVTSARCGFAKGKAKVSGVCTRLRGGGRASATRGRCEKIPESLAARAAMRFRLISQRFTVSFPLRVGLESAAGLGEVGGEKVFVRQRHPVFGGQYFVWQTFQLTAVGKREQSGSGIPQTVSAICQTMSGKSAQVDTPDKTREPAADLWREYA